MTLSVSESLGKLFDLVKLLILNKNASDAECEQAKAEAVGLITITEADLTKLNELIDVATAATVKPISDSVEQDPESGFTDED